jgi:hypothetical protein
LTLLKGDIMEGQISLVVLSRLWRRQLGLMAILGKVNDALVADRDSARVVKGRTVELLESSPTVSKVVIEPEGPLTAEDWLPLRASLVDGTGSYPRADCSPHCVRWRIHLKQREQCQGKMALHH